MKPEKYWSWIILALIALSIWTMVATRYDTKTHRRVPRYPIHYGLDIHGGARAVLRARIDQLPKNVQYDKTAVLNILENRINGAGVGEATVQPKGNDQFVIELPEVRNKDAILQQLGTTASMTFYYLKDVSSGKHPNEPLRMSVDRDAAGKEADSFLVTHVWQPFPQGVADHPELKYLTGLAFPAGTGFRDGAHVRADFTNVLAGGTGARPGATAYTVPAPLAGMLPDPKVFFTPSQKEQATELNRELEGWTALIADSPRILGGTDIQPRSTAHLGGSLGTDPVVTQVFTSDGARKMGEFTRAHFGENGTGDIMGIVLDDALLSAPNIEGVIQDEGEIHGGFRSLGEAQSLANLLNAGTLPVPLEQVQTESVEASLGAGAVSQSIKAGLLGLALVLLFMLLYYRLPGLVADIALLIYALFTLAIFRAGFPLLNIPPVTLTLPGIAGFILSIGMAVDANILIFERLKEELRNGKSLRGAIDAGFRRAFTAIRDSNICTAITCVVLLSLGTPSVRGFALTLLIGVAISLFSAITVTRTLLYLLVDAGIGNNPALFGLNVRAPGGSDANGPGLNIIGRRRFFYALSAAIIVPGLIFLLGLHGLKQSIEFTGGSQMEVRYTQPVTQAAVESALSQAGFHKPHVQMAEGGSATIVSTKEHSSVANPALNPVHQQLARALATLGPNQELQFGNVGGTISAELASRAFQAVVIASLLIVLYLATVFSIGGFVAGLRFGVSAIAALLHDVLVLLGAFAIFGYFLDWEIDSLFVTALLTVIGFSVHDTVVIFDRVRENLHHRSRSDQFEPLVNRSIQQTLARSINTSLTVVMTLIALVLLGGHTTRLLNVALLIGIISGTYSSIFNAASILVDWENALARRGTGLPAPAVAAGAAPRPQPAGGARIYPANGDARSPGAAPRPVGTPSLSPRASSRTAADANGAEEARIRPKKKKPVRRF